MLQISGDLSVYTKSIRVSEKIGLPRVWEADSYAEICLIFYKDGTNCSTEFHELYILASSEVNALFMKSFIVVPALAAAIATLP